MAPEARYPLAKAVVLQGGSQGYAAQQMIATVEQATVINRANGGRIRILEASR
jgi:hypothetical protein